MASDDELSRLLDIPGPPDVKPAKELTKVKSQKPRSKKGQPLMDRIEFEGTGFPTEISGVPIPDDLPVVANAPMSKEDRRAIAKVILDVYAQNEFTLLDISKTLGVRSSATFAKWRIEDPKIRKMQKAAKKERTKKYKWTLAEQARRGLKRSIEGQTRVLTTMKLKTPTLADKKNAPGIVLAQEEIQQEIYIQPNIKAIMFALTNAEPEDFRNNPDDASAPGDQESIPIISWVG